MKNMIWR